jgi:hypothetical protein
MEREGSLPFSQEPTTSLCPEPDESSPQIELFRYRGYSTAFKEMSEW